MNGKAPYIALTVIASLALAALVWFGLFARPGQRAAEELSAIAADLAPDITAEDLGPERTRRVNEFLAKLKPENKPGQELLLGARAFMAQNPRQADRHFEAALAAAADEPNLLSFKAAANLRLGNAALAVELYGRAMALKRQADYSPLELSYDQVGLALSLFMLGRPAEAAPLAEEARQARSRYLGAGAPDTLSAATRLAAVYVALNEKAKAESLLKAVYSQAGAGEVDAEVAREEAAILLRVLYTQSGRQEELKELLESPPSLPPQAAAGAAEVGRRTVGVQEAIKAMQPKVVTAEDLAAWDKMAVGLDGYNDGLAAELRVRAILGRVVLEGVDFRHPDLLWVRLALARAWIDSGRFGLAEELLNEIAAEVTDYGSLEFLELSSLLAESLDGEERFKEAENHWRKAAEAADARLAASLRTNAKPEAADVDHSLRFHFKLAENYLKQNKVAPEAEIEILTALAHLEDLGVSNPADYPAAGWLYLRLADLVRDMSRLSESADYYRRARSAAEALLGKNPDHKTRVELQKIIEQAVSASVSLDSKSSSSSTSDQADRRQLPTVELLRLELSALAALGRLDEFQPVLTPVLAEAANRFGQASPQYMRYYGLRLKWLEASGRVEELTGELKAQAVNPPGRNDAERVLNQAGALIYAARVNEKAGRESAAIELYQEALAGLEWRTEPIIAERRKMIETALTELAPPGKNKKAGGSK